LIKSAEVCRYAEYSAKVCGYAEYRSEVCRYAELYEQGIGIRGRYFEKWRRMQVSYMHSLQGGAGKKETKMNKWRSMQLCVLYEPARKRGQDGEVEKYAGMQSLATPGI
jgi:hypothetical protein